MIEFGLILGRLLHYVATTTLFGASLFPLYAYGRVELEALERWRTRLLLSTAIAAIVSGLLWFAFSAANMSGSLSDLADPETLWAVARDTNFGIVWTARMVLAVLIVVLTAVCAFGTITTRNLIVSILAAMLLASVAGTGHTQVEEGLVSILHVLSDAAHLLAAGAWLGGLVPLAYILFQVEAGRDIAPIDQVLLRFSGMGYVAVATLLGTGLINGWLLVGSVTNLVTTPYGQTLLVKLVLFAGMLVLAAANRFWLAPSLSNVRSNSFDDRASWIHTLRNHVLGEQLLGALILIIASVLGTMQPAIGR